MKIQIDIKSALFGLALGVVAMSAIGAGTSASEAGRYQVSVGQDFFAVVDTKTGEVWGHEANTSGLGGKDGHIWNAKQP